KFEPYIGMAFANINWIPYLQQGGRNQYNNNDLWLSGGLELTPTKRLKVVSDFSFNYFNRNAHDVASKVDLLASADLTNLQIANGYSGVDYVDERSIFNRYYVLNA